MPVTMIAFAIGATGMCGIPPVAGFISKWFLCLGAVQAGAFIFLCVILVSSILDVIYFFPIVRMAFFKKPNPDTFTNTNWFSSMEAQKPIYLLMIVPLAITAFFSIIGAASISAFPLFSGFISKSLTVAAVAEHHQSYRDA